MKENIMYFFLSILLIIFVVCLVFGALFLIVKISDDYEKEYPCIKSHEETVQQMPYSIVSGNLAIPIGNIETKKVIICDERKSK